MASESLWEAQESWIGKHLTLVDNLLSISTNWARSNFSSDQILFVNRELQADCKQFITHHAKSQTQTNMNAWLKNDFVLSTEVCDVEHAIYCKLEAWMVWDKCNVKTLILTLISTSMIQRSLQQTVPKSNLCMLFSINLNSAIPIKPNQISVWPYKLKQWLC